MFPRPDCCLDVNDLGAQHFFDVICVPSFQSLPHSTFEVDGDECVANVSLTSLLLLFAGALMS